MMNNTLLKERVIFGRQRYFCQCRRLVRRRTWLSSSACTQRRWSEFLQASAAWEAVAHISNRTAGALFDYPFNPRIPFITFRACTHLSPPVLFLRWIYWEHSNWSSCESCKKRWCMNDDEPAKHGINHANRHHAERISIHTHLIR